jgi:hypothetical protein
MWAPQKKLTIINLLEATIYPRRVPRKPYTLLDLPVCDPNKIFTAEGDNVGVVAPEMSRKAISLALLLICERDGFVWILRQIFLTGNIRLLR